MVQARRYGVAPTTVRSIADLGRFDVLLVYYDRFFLANLMLIEPTSSSQAHSPSPDSPLKQTRVVCEANLTAVVT